MSLQVCKSCAMLRFGAVCRPHSFANSKISDTPSQWCKNEGNKCLLGFQDRLHPEWYSLIHLKTWPSADCVRQIIYSSVQQIRKFTNMLNRKKWRFCMHVGMSQYFAKRSCNCELLLARPPILVCFLRNQHFRGQIPCWKVSLEHVASKPESSVPFWVLKVGNPPILNQLSFFPPNLCCPV